MGDHSSDDSLPEGWRMEVKVRKNGKKDKCYFAPSGGVKFFSKVEVYRYLNNCHLKSEEKEKGIDQQSPKNVVVEKVTPEGLPPGWTKEIRVTKKSHRIRRDPFYTDPVSGYVFRSMKDALRYLETGEVRRLAFKPKDKGSNELELEDDKTCSPVESKKQKLAVNGTTSPSISEETKMHDIVKDEEILNSGCTQGCNPTSERRFTNESRTSELPEDEGSDQKEGKTDSAKSVCVADPAVGVIPQKQLLENEVNKDETKRTGYKSKDKKDLHMPRRSKRLAGVPLDPTPELKTTKQAHQTADKLANKIATPTADGPSLDQCDSVLEANYVFDTSKSRKMSLESKRTKHSTGYVATPNEHYRNVDTNNMVDEKHDCHVSSQGNVTITKECAGNVERDNNDDEKKPGLPFDVPLGELWHDPCIAFAIKTLTGISFDTYNSTPRSENIGSAGLVTSEEHARKDMRNAGDKEQRHADVRPLHDIGIPQTSTGEVEKNGKAGDKAVSSLNLPFAEVWADPCIEFAIKTLTGAIPLDYDMVRQEYRPQQASSSQPK